MIFLPVGSGVSAAKAADRIVLVRRRRKRLRTELSSVHLHLHHTDALDAVVEMFLTADYTDFHAQEHEVLAL